MLYAIKSNKQELTDVVWNCGASAGPYTHHTIVRLGCCPPAVLQLVLILSLQTKCIDLTCALTVHLPIIVTFRGS